MLLNHLTIAVRNLVRHKLYSAISISGLAIGLTCTILITLFVRDQLSYDRWLPGTDNLYRLEVTNRPPGRLPQDYATVPFMAPQAMHEEIPGVAGFTRLDTEYMTFTYGARQFGETVRAVDPNFITFLNLPMVRGDAANALAQPQSVVLSERLARKYFGDLDPVGKVMTVNRPSCPLDTTPCQTGSIALRVTGVLKDIPHNSQLAADILLPNISIADTFGRDHRQDWSKPNSYAFLRLDEGVAPQSVLARLDPILDREVGPRLAQLGIRMPGHALYSMHLTPFQRVHLDGARNATITPPGNWTTVYGVGAIGLLIILMACFNFTNLATAQATLRAREAAVRKTFGARRAQLVVQFLCEAVLFSLLALIAALALVEVLLPWFGAFLEAPITFSYLADWPVLALSVAIAVGAGLLSGAYPALLLSGIRPASVLRGGRSLGTGSTLLRSGVVVFQYAVSIALGICTLVVFNQIDHARQVKLGFRHDHIVTLYTGSALTVASRESLLQQLVSYPGIEAAAQSNDVPFTQANPLANARLAGASDNAIVNWTNIGPGFRALYGIPLLAGRDFARERADDRIASAQVTDILKSGAGNGPNPVNNEGHSVMLNQAAAVRLGLTPRQAVGRALILDNIRFIVVGVMEDARFHGARETAKPSVFYFDPDDAKLISLRVRWEQLRGTLSFIDQTWRALAPQTAVSRRFLDDGFQSLYSADLRQGQMFGVFVGLAIFIAVLGLFGVASFTAKRRTREIGIRKVFGASTQDMVLLLLRQFSIPVLLANLIAWPLAWYYLNGWLQGFADRISLNPLYFVGVGAMALIVAWATLFSHTLRVARANPVSVLR
jgi:putative ABC transport system permease protein